MDFSFNLLRRFVTPFQGREAIVCVPALIALPLAGAATDHAVVGAIAAGAAFSVGFGATRALMGRRVTTMAAATLGMAVATFAGSIAAHDPVMLVLFAAIVAAACAWLALVDENLWWVVLQWAIAFLVAGNYPGQANAEIERAAAVLVGGSIQLVCVLALHVVLPPPPLPPPAAGRSDNPSRTQMVWHMIRAAACVAGSLALANALHLSNSYWAPMTALLVLKPGLHETDMRGASRLAGTVLGCAAATLLVLTSRDIMVLAVAEFGFLAFAAFALQKAPYAVFSFSVTASVVQLLALGGAPVVASADHRTLATILGGGLALVVAHVGPRRPATVHRTATDRLG